MSDLIRVAALRLLFHLTVYNQIMFLQANMDPIMYDHYAVAERIAGELEEQGHHVWSERLRDAIASGSTGTEICMALRWQLDRMRDARLGVLPETLSESNELFGRLDRLLSFDK